MGVHNFIYAFSPDVKFNSESEYLERYPGDDYVDLLGMDDYADFGRAGRYDISGAVKKLKIVSDLAIKKNKLAAFTETGLESIRDFQTLEPSIKFLSTKFHSELTLSLFQ